MDEKEINVTIQKICKNDSNEVYFETLCGKFGYQEIFIQNLMLNPENPIEEVLMDLIATHLSMHVGEKSKSEAEKYYEYKPNIVLLNYNDYKKELEDIFKIIIGFIMKSIDLVDLYNKQICTYYKLMGIDEYESDYN